MSVRIEAEIDDEGNVSISYEGEVYLICTLARRIQIDADNMLMDATADDEETNPGFTQ
jgi:hypothetical protein